ncbi:hypothetical protein KIPB_000773 [Kipferlia bialata]|uniref:Polysaccharide biosynthesis domain-containing protein n=1 Tax=Kipferlia bialata TaxID=797122 RepID=A0A391NIA8_9EUKA|nr:hypothetical protein KIPB_000773 [Kipferlia bialata]|eukprot:g773.t1
MSKNSKRNARRRKRAAVRHQVNATQPLSTGTFTEGPSPSTAATGAGRQVTPCDDWLYKEFRRVFPTMPVATLTDSDENQPLWRSIGDAMRRKGLSWLDEGAHLLCVDAAKPFMFGNVVFVPWDIYYCLEVAREREGLYDWMH